jgi:hypothetical protein
MTATALQGFPAMHAAILAAVTTLSARSAPALRAEKGTHMRRLPLVVVAASIFLACSVIPTTAGPATPDAEAELRGITQEMLDAVALGNVDVWRRYLHEGVIHVDENGKVRSKADLLEELRPLPAGLSGRIEIDTFKAEIHDDVAIVTHEDQEHLDYFGQKLATRFRSTDTWQRTPAGWRLIAQQTAAVLKDPPTIALTQEQLCIYNGSYALTKDMVARIQCVDGGLSFERTARPMVKYLPEVDGVFFIPGQPRTRRIFMRDAAGRVVGFVDRREGEDIRWTKLP